MKKTQRGMPDLRTLDDPYVQPLEPPDLRTLDDPPAPPPPASPAPEPAPRRGWRDRLAAWWARLPD